MKRFYFSVAFVATVLIGLAASAARAADAPWPMHVVDQSSRGADGVRLADVNGDGLLDIATGWEEGGVVRVCINPGPQKSKQPWPSVEVGKVGSPEDAVLVDLDGDGALDVVSCSEGSTRSVNFHWAPKNTGDYLTSSAWQTEVVPATKDRTLWMFSLPMQIDRRHGVDLIVGSKSHGAMIGWLEAPANPRTIADWELHTVYKSAGWIMSLVAFDMDADGDLDVVASDRKGKNPRVMWLENPGAEQVLASRPWAVHPIGAQGKEVMFLTLHDLNGDGRMDIVAATENNSIALLLRKGDDPDVWQEHAIGNPGNAVAGKAVAVGDIDLDGRLDLVHTADLTGRKPSDTTVAVTWLSYRDSILDSQWQMHAISAPGVGKKFDLVQLIDLDGDGDLDALTCAERENLGVIWYENPAR